MGSDHLVDGKIETLTLLASSSILDILGMMLLFNYSA